MGKYKRDRSESIMEEMRNYWFKDHKAKVTKNGDITILDWKNPNNCNYYVRYVLDGYRMYISGDIGEAVFDLTWKATIDSFSDINLDYFLSKMSTSSNGKYIYDGKQAKRALLEWKHDIMNDYEFGNDHEKEEFVETMENLMDAAVNCDTSEEWLWKYANGEYYDFITDYEEDCLEWIGTIGDVIQYHNHAFLVGLKMAAEQLKQIEQNHRKDFLSTEKYYLFNEGPLYSISKIKRINEKTVTMDNGFRLKLEDIYKLRELTDEEADLYKGAVIKNIIRNRLNIVTDFTQSLRVLKQVLNCSEFVSIDTAKLQGRIDAVDLVLEKTFCSTELNIGGKNFEMAFRNHTTLKEI